MIFGAVLAGVAAIAVPAPAAAFSLFGFHLFGEKDEADAEIVDPVPYSATILLEADDRKLAKNLNKASLLVRKQDEPPSGTVGLIARARDDRTNLLGLLYQRAFYGSTVSIVIGGRPLEQISVTETLTPFAGKVPVTVTIQTGPVFEFGKISYSGSDPAVAERAAAKAGLISGSRASSLTIVEAEAGIVRAWKQAGHPFAQIAEREVVADHATKKLDVALRIEPGRSAVLGAPQVSGTSRVDPAFLARQADVPEGAPYHPDTIAQIRRRLAKLDALASVSVDVGETVGADGRVPVIIEVSERKRRTVGAGALYSSTEGLAVQSFWMHRNLLGRAETLRVDASIGRLLEADNLDEYDGLFSVLFSKPGFLDPRNRLDLKLTALQEDPDPYNRRGFVVEGRIVHEFDEKLSVSGGVTFDWARIDDAFGRNFYTLVSLPLTLTYDDRNSILDPTEGIYAQVRGEPQIETSSTSLFFTADTELRAYLALDDEARFVLAGRARAGTIAGADLVEIPAHRRFYAGGGGSVRGFDYLNIGPRVPGFGATGGLSRAEASLEARIKVTDNIGVVPFVDAGLVTTDVLFGGDGEFRVGVGMGLRYYTSVGPIRLDVAVPINPHLSDPDFAVYAGIGQAF